MKDCIRKSGIFIGNLLVCASFTIVSPFYSKVAEDLGIEKWLIGVIYSSCPTASLLISFFLQPFMQKLGRTKILLLGMLLECANMLIIAFVPFSSFGIAVLLSLLSRIIAGCGSAMFVISSYSILTSDYPEEVSQMIALMEIFSGLGLIMGPLFGSAAYLLGGFTISCLIISTILVIYIPIIYFCAGPSRPYILSDDHISMKKVAAKPKILLDIGMQLLIMFMVGYLLPTTQLHLLEYGVKEENSGYWFSINTFCYFLSSFFVSFIPQNVSKPKQMLLGNFIMVFSLLFIGPCPFILPEKLAFTGIGLMLFGLSGGFIYVPSMPHMLEAARNDYGYENDHRLNDAMSGITNISLCIGEIMGPIVSAILDTFLGYSMAATVVSVFTLIHALNYMILSDAVTYKKVGDKGQNKILSSELISMKNKNSD
ncbi:hypothetical protein SteCoe_26716 [Stentor coeruleus]|uniref:Major facilitator superfamily (MFS) profile domain-containing protein n=1 Tax=Stentor coeruleus TaxID=5963 RepID=A0A1R2BC94_9CILI|nr:hypothetical protein SteCoe_26716 [Stentor coeruleus]